MNFVIKLLLIVLFLSFRPAFSQETRLSTGLICDTPKQVARFLTLYDELKNDALKRVNDENATTACAVATVVFVVAEEIEVVRNSGGAFAITHIFVIGLATPYGVQRVEPFEQYTIFKAKGEDV